MFPDSLKHFENWFFLVVPLHKEARATMCTIWNSMGDRRTDLFHKYWNKGHFLKGNGSYVYKEDDLSHEEFYLKK